MNRMEWLAAYSMARAVRRCEEALFGGKLTSLGMSSHFEADKLTGRYQDGGVITQDPLKYRIGMFGRSSRISGRAVQP